MKRGDGFRALDAGSPRSLEADGIGRPRRLRKSEAVATRAIAGETLVVPFRGTLASLRQIFALNSVAAFVWERIDGQTGLDAILAQVVASFHVEEGRARADLEELTADLLAAGLLEEVAGDPVAEQP